MPSLWEQHPAPRPGTSQPSLGTARAGASPCSKLPGDTCIDTAKRKVRHSEELRFSPFYRLDSGQTPRDAPALPRPQAAASGTTAERPPLPGTTPGAGTRAALHRLNPRLDHLTSAFPSQGKAPGRSERSGAAAATLGTLGSSLEHPTARNPQCRSSNPKHTVSRWECLWNTLSTLQDPALEQTVASLQWESFHRSHPSSGSSRGGIVLVL